MRTLFTSSCLSIVLGAWSIVACGDAGQAADESAADSGSGGSAQTAGGTSSGGSGQASGGNSSGGASGSASTGGAPATGGESNETPPSLQVDFADAAGFDVVAKDDLIPGASASLVDAAAADDGKAIALVVPGNAAYDDADFVGPGAHAIELHIGDGAQLYGRYEFRVRFASCQPTEELVSGIFTYFNDGSDQDENGIADNSEIDVEHLCGDPGYLWLTVWTDYEETPAVTFRRSSRLVNMRTGAVSNTPLGSGSFDDGLEPAGTIAGLALTDFPAADTYYHLGFEWRADSVRYFIVLGGQEIELWDLQGAAYVPQRAAEFLVNLWHPDTHWSKTGAADFPSNDGSLFIDWVKIWP